MKNKVKFGAYFKAYCSGFNTAEVSFGKPGADYGVAIFDMVLIFILMIGLSASKEGFAIHTGIQMGAYFMFAIILSSRVVFCKPSLFNLMPIGYKRKTVYFLLSVILAVVVASIAIDVAFIAMIFVLAVLTFFFTGEWTFVAEENAQTAELASTCLQGGFLQLGIFLCIVGLTLIIAFIKRRTLRNILLMVQPCFVFIPLFIYRNAAGVESGTLFSKLDIYPCSELIVCLFVIAGAALVAIGVIRLFAIMKPKEF